MKNVWIAFLTPQCQTGGDGLQGWRMKWKLSHRRAKQKTSSFLHSSEHIWVWNDRRGKKTTTTKKNMIVRWALAQLAQGGRSHDEVHRWAAGLCGLCTEEALSGRGEAALSSSALKWSPDDPQRPVTYIHFFHWFINFHLFYFNLTASNATTWKFPKRHICLCRHWRDTNDTITETLYSFPKCAITWLHLFSQVTTCSCAPISRVSIV